MNAPAFICPVCNKSFDNDNGQRHLKTHGIQIACPFCLKKLSRSDKLLKHCTSIHSNETPPFQCPFCATDTNDPEFPTVKDFCKHISQKHRTLQDNLPENVKELLQRQLKHVRAPTNIDNVVVEQQPAATSEASSSTTGTSVQPPTESVVGQPRGTAVESPSSTTDISEHLATEPVAPSNKRLKLADLRFSSNVPANTLEESAVPVAIVDHFPVEYDPDNETGDEVPEWIMQSVFDQVPEPAHPLIQLNWRLIRSMRNETNILTREYNLRLIGNDDETAEAYFTRAVHDRQTTAYKVVCSAGFLLQNLENPNEFRVFDPQKNNHNIQIPPMREDRPPTADPVVQPRQADTPVDNDLMEYDDEAELAAAIAEAVRLNPGGQKSSATVPDTTKQQDKPFMINNAKSLEHFLKHINWQTVMDSARLPDTKWRVEAVLNIRFWVIRLDRAIGCSDCTIPQYLKANKYVTNFLVDGSRHRHEDHLCVFRILSHVLDGEVKGCRVHERFHQWYSGHEPGEEGVDMSAAGLKATRKGFTGVDFNQLDSVEHMFGVMFNVYQIHEDGCTHLLRRSPKKDNATLINVDLSQQKGTHISHFSLILNLDKYAKKWFCNICQRKFIRSRKIRQHEKICKKGKTQMTFPGGVHKEKANIFQRLKNLGVPVRDNLETFYPFRAVYDFESMLKTITTARKVKENGKSGGIEVSEATESVIQRPATDGMEEAAVFAKHKLQTATYDDPDSEPPKLQFFQLHAPISFSILSDVPGFTDPFTVIEPNPKLLIKQFLEHLEAIAEQAKLLIRAKYSEELAAADEILRVAKKAVKDRAAEDGATLEDEEDVVGVPVGSVKNKKKKRRLTNRQSTWYNKVKAVVGELKTWSEQFPVLGFNSSGYDLPLIREYLYPLMVELACDAATPQQLYDYDRAMANRLRIRMYAKGAKDVEEPPEHPNGPNATLNTPVDEDDEPNRRRAVRAFFDMEARETRSVSETDESSSSETESVHDEDPADEEDNLVQEDDKENAPTNMKGFPKVIKQGRTIACLSTATLKFLDMSRYLAAGSSLDGFQTAWLKSDQTRRKNGQEPDKFGDLVLKKLPFPYTFLDSPDKLFHEGVPHRDFFYNQLKGSPISDESYALVEQIYRDNDMQYFHQYLRKYNEIDTMPFLQAVQKQFTQYYKETGVDLFKEALSLPGVTLKYLYQNTKGYLFGLWKTGDEQLHEELRRDMTGGLSLVMHRHAIAGETIIRGHEMGEGKRPAEDFHKVKTIIGEDANALYLYALGQDMPTGFPTHWSIKADHLSVLYKRREGKLASQQWLEILAAQNDIEIITKFSHGFESRIGPLQISVDGYCEETDTVYEFDGCYYHCHGKDNCKHKFPTDEHHGYTTESCAFAIEDRRRYVESLGKKYVSIWECDWEEMKKNDPAIQKALKQMNKKWFNRTFAPQDKMLEAICSKEIFGFVQVDMDTPEHLRKLHHFQDFPPIVKNVTISRDDLSPHMKEHCERFNLMEQPRKSLISSFKAEKQWFLTSYVAYLVAKGVVVSKIYQVVQYECKRPFLWFQDKVTKARMAADADPAMEILGLAFKLIGNCGYGKTITDITKHQDVHIVPLSHAREICHDPYLASLEPIGGTETYEAVLYKRSLKQELPEQIGMAVYQHAKLRMLEFAYDFLGKYADPYKYAWLETDTDSAYLMLAGDTLDDIIKPEMLAEYEADKHNWLVIDEKKDKRTPGLFKQEFKGEKMICLASKTYQVVAADGKSKSATKGLQTHNNFGFEMFQKVLDEGMAGTGKAGRGFNTGFQHTPGGKIATYICERNALSYLYPKRYMEDDGVTTRPYPDL